MNIKLWKLLATHCVVLAIGLAVGYQAPRLVRYGKVRLERAQIQSQLKSDPKSAADWTSLGVLDANLGNKDDALKDFGTALNLDPSDAQALLGTGYIYFHDKNYAVAKQWYEKMLKVAQDNNDSTYECEARMMLQSIQSAK